MSTATIVAPIAHVFNPQQWLADFEKVGGGYTLTDETIHLGFLVIGRSADDQAKARDMIDALSDDARSAIITYLRREESEKIAATLGPDMAIRVAWSRRKAAYARYSAAQDTDPDWDEVEADCWATIDAMEGTIEQTIASSIDTVTMQLWCALSHVLQDRKPDQAATRCDLDALEDMRESLDWNARLLVTALRGLSAMEA